MRPPHSVVAEIGRALIFFGAALVVLGLLLTFLPVLRLGRLPGDILVRRESWSLYIPITTSIVISIVLSLIFWLLSVWKR